MNIKFSLRPTLSYKEIVRPDSRLFPRTDMKNLLYVTTQDIYIPFHDITKKCKQSSDCSNSNASKNKDFYFHCISALNNV